jgi:membrane protein
VNEPAINEPSSNTATPSAFALSLRDWKEVLLLGFRQAGGDNIGLAAAGVAFYAFLAIVPLLLSAVLIYGLAADTQTVAEHVNAMASVLPAAATEIIQGELESIVAGSGDKKGLGLAIALGLALFAARNGAAAVITALGIAYDREDDRGIVRRTLLALLLTLAGILCGAIFIGAVVLFAALEAFVPGIGGSAVIYKVATYVGLLLAGMAIAGALYRYGPNAAEPRWQWATPGSVFAALGWIALTAGFGFYVDNFGNYDATYGSLGAVIVLLTWIYLSAYVLLLGAEFNAAARRRVRERD